MKPRSDASPSAAGHAWMLVLYILVALLMLVSVLFGAYVYNDAFRTDERYSRVRSVEGFIASTFNANDSGATASVGQGPEGDMLRIQAADGVYEQCIYLHEGRLVEEYKAVKLDISPEDAVPVAELSSFAASVDGVRVTLDTDLGTFVNVMRSGGEGA